MTALAVPVIAHPSARPPAAPPRADAAGAGDGGRVGGAVYASIAAAALAVAYLTAVLLAPALRRRRRRTGDPGDRITGAWHQALDHLADVGLSTARTLTAHEVAGFGAAEVGEDARGHLGPLADLVNRSRFAASRPDPNAADRAWHHRPARTARHREGRAAAPAPPPAAPALAPRPARQDVAGR
ncbi:DUF4129 domain-containing protein [Actinomadura sp. LD22]|uniref:DUF4129 domain-containing protein n=1 Tax=Actinomadura physcomitrii TaxID=2650748 RepID=A0A6I4M820_9ACTN|nr:DUF4129 domain-containing protein [Actinomadura physcomitrii]MWA01833.1 DUF4129 domain-containing protein [Actinomadura physcomitrii]